MERRIGIVVSLILAGLLFCDHASLGASSDITPEPCGGADVTAYVSKSSGKCYVRGIDPAKREKRRRAVKDGAVRAGEQIECSTNANLTLTFCASGADVAIRGRDIKKYIVPNVPGKDRPEQENLDPALRRASEQPATDGQRLLAQASTGKPLEIPVCEKKIGTLAIIEPEQKWWVAYNLQSPEALIKVFVTQSKCFSLVDRGKGLMAAQAERALASSELKGGSNMGKNQMKAADYVLVPDLVGKNADAGGKRIGGLLGGMMGGAAVGGISLKSKAADVVLSLIDVRSAEQIALSQGHANKTDLSWSGEAVVDLIAAGGASSYANTEIGQVVTAAYLDSFTKLVAGAKGLSLTAKADNVTQSVTMARSGKMYEQADVKSKIVRDLEPGVTLYPTGEKEEIWWQVSDDLGNIGWVASTLFEFVR